MNWTKTERISILNVEEGRIQVFPSPKDNGKRAIGRKEPTGLYSKRRADRSSNSKEVSKKEGRTEVLGEGRRGGGQASVKVDKSTREGRKPRRLLIFHWYSYGWDHNATTQKNGEVRMIWGQASRWRRRDSLVFFDLLRPVIKETQQPRKRTDTRRPSNRRLRHRPRNSNMRKRNKPLCRRKNQVRREGPLKTRWSSGEPVKSVKG